VSGVVVYEASPDWQVCGVIYTLGDCDCFCGLPPHAEDVPHECVAVGCGRSWTSYRVLASDGAA
jgi:hypothetical protein